jgi:hypothetical protein
MPELPEGMEDGEDRMDSLRLMLKLQNSKRVLYLVGLEKWLGLELEGLLVEQLQVSEGTLLEKL